MKYELPVVKTNSFEEVVASVSLVSAELMSQEQELVNIQKSKSIFKLAVRKSNEENVSQSIKDLTTLKEELITKRKEVFESDIEKDQEKHKEDSAGMFLISSTNDAMEDRVSDLVVNTTKLMYVTDLLGERISRLELNAVDEQNTSLSGSTKPLTKLPDVKKTDTGWKSPTTDDINFAILGLFGGLAALNTLRELGALGLGAVTMFKQLFFDLPKAIFYDFPKWIGQQVMKLVQPLIDDIMKPFVEFKTFVMEKLAVIVQWMDNAVEKILVGVKTWAQGVIDDLMKPFKEVMEKVSSYFGGMKDKAISAADDIGKSAKNLVTEAWGGVKSTLASGVDYVSDVAKAGKDKVVEVVEVGAKAVAESSVGKYAIEKGGQLIQFGEKKVAAIVGPIKEIVEGKVVPIFTRLMEDKFGGTAAKSILKKIPAISILAGLGFGAYEMFQGNWEKGLLEILSGFVASIPIPFVGAAASMGIDYYNSTIPGKDGDSRTVSSIIADNIILGLSGEGDKAEGKPQQVSQNNSEVGPDGKPFKDGPLSPPVQTNEVIERIDLSPPSVNASATVDKDTQAIKNALVDSGKTQGYGKKVEKVINASPSEVDKSDKSNINKSNMIDNIGKNSAQSNVIVVKNDAPVSNTVNTQVSKPEDGSSLFPLFF